MAAGIYETSARLLTAGLRSLPVCVTYHAEAFHSTGHSLLQVGRLLVHLFTSLFLIFFIQGECSETLTQDTRDPRDRSGRASYRRELSGYTDTSGVLSPHGRQCYKE